MYENEKPDNKVRSYTMTPEELKAYLASLPAPPKKIKESDIGTLAPQLGFEGGKKYRRTGGDH